MAIVVSRHTFIDASCPIQEGSRFAAVVVHISCPIKVTHLLFTSVASCSKLSKRDPFFIDASCTKFKKADPFIDASCCPFKKAAACGRSSQLSNKRRLFRGRSCSHQLPNNSDPFIDTCCLIQEGGRFAAVVSNCPKETHNNFFDGSCTKSKRRVIISTS